MNESLLVGLMTFSLSLALVAIFGLVYGVAGLLGVAVVLCCATVGVAAGVIDHWTGRRKKKTDGED